VFWFGVALSLSQGLGLGFSHGEDSFGLSSRGEAGAAPEMGIRSYSDRSRAWSLPIPRAGPSLRMASSATYSSRVRGLA